MNETVKFSQEQAATIAAVIAPDIRAYIDTHREEYKTFLMQWNEKHGEAGI